MIAAGLDGGNTLIFFFAENANKSLLLRQVMNFLTNTAVNLEFNPMAFVENLEYMGVGMVVIFAIIGVIILATKLVNSPTWAHPILHFAAVQKKTTKMF